MGKRPIDQPIRVLVVEDSRAQRELLVGLLRAGGLVVAGTASDGREAIAATQQLRPDVIAMDIHLPGLDGYAATRQIMQSSPTPIVLVSGVGDAQQRVLDALAAGALAVVRKPGSTAHPDHIRDRDTLLTTLRLMADVLVVTRHSSHYTTSAQTQSISEREQGGLLLRSPSTSSSRERPAPILPQVLAIAASTGGPAAVQTLLSGLGGGFQLPILIVQHIARGFVEALADWLGKTTHLPVRVVRAEERLLPGHVYLAPDDHHLLVRVPGFVTLRAMQSSDRYCPSGDVLFESVAAAYQRRAIGVMLTGMGDDGARGLRTLRMAGSLTLAQDEASCVVYGMPKAAVAAGAVDQIEPLANLARAINQQMIEGSNHLKQV